MAKKKSLEPSEFEMQILAVLWDNAPCTVREVMELLPDDKERAYTSVLSVMQVMEKKGLIKHAAKGKSYQYSAVQSKEKTLGSFFDRLVGNVFSGSPARLVESLIGSDKIDAQELEAIKQIIDKHKG